MKIINNTLTDLFIPLHFKGVRNDITKTITYGYLFIIVLKQFKTKHPNQIGESIREPSKPGESIGLKCEAKTKRKAIMYLKSIIIEPTI